MHFNLKCNLFNLSFFVRSRLDELKVPQSQSNSKRFGAVYRKNSVNVIGNAISRLCMSGEDSGVLQLSTGC